MSCRHDFVDFGNPAESYFNGDRNGREQNPWVDFTRDFRVALEQMSFLANMYQQNMLAHAAFQNLYAANYPPYVVLSGNDIYGGDAPNQPINTDAPIGPCPPGYDAAKWNNPNHNTIKYDVSRNLAKVIDQVRAIPDEPGRKRFMEEFLKSQVPLIEARGGKVLQIKNEKILLDVGEGPHWIDTVRDVGGEAGVQWLPV